MNAEFNLTPIRTITHMELSCYNMTVRTWLSFASLTIYYKQTANLCSYSNTPINGTPDCFTLEL